MQTPETKPQSATIGPETIFNADNYKTEQSHFLVCGLGSLGQFCVAALKEFGVSVHAITTACPESWEITNLPGLVDSLLMGDCRQPDVLERAGVKDCRAVLIVTNDERVNIEAAFAVKLLNPEVRVVVRSTKQNLNQLLEQGLGNFVALDASQLPAPAFAIAALGSEIRGLIHLDAYMLLVVKVSIDTTHRWCDRRFLHELNTQTRRLLSHISAGSPLPVGFYQWEPDARVQAGDQVAYIEVVDRFTDLISVPSAGTPVKARSEAKPFWHKLRHFSSYHLGQKLVNWWQVTAQQPTKRVATVVGVTMLVLWLLGTLTFKLTNSQISLLSAFYTAGVMLLGSYDTVFGALDPQDSFPVWMRIMNLTYMLAGTASIAVLYALLTETLLVAKFQLPKKRPPVPLQGHVILIGLGRLGRRVATFLQQMRQPLVGVSNVPLESTILPSMPLVVGDLANSLSKVNLATARSVVIATDDEMANLELGLMAHAANPDCALVIRTFDPRFSASIDGLLPYAKVLCAYDLAADAFVATVFGENVLSLLRLNEQTVLVIEYMIKSEDMLNRRLLAEVAYGYGVVPVLYHSLAKGTVRFMPSDDIRLEMDDRLVVLATSDGLQRIERGEMYPRRWQVTINKASSKDSIFDGSMAIARITGCSINQAREVMNQLPAVLPFPLYKHQAQRLVRELSKSQVVAQLVSLSA
ncbi:potassium channel family protein [Leptothermofonsia sp. ETS-13]|uniref:potassium channel family protein n=1 Tax=Leptothermofonsia sp. ETS-13 TaxID=3035696 RepID=UPI003BA2826F